MTQTVDTLFINAIVLTMDRNLNQYDPGAVAVKGDSIVAVGKEAEIKNEYSANEIIDCKGRVLMPGLINAHTHVPMTLMRGLADDLRLDVGDVHVRAARGIFCGRQKGAEIRLADAALLDEKKIVDDDAFFLQHLRCGRRGAGRQAADVGVVATAANKEKNF